MCVQILSVTEQRAIPWGIKPIINRQQLCYTTAPWVLFSQIAAARAISIFD
jgi:hypothetical protein